MVFQNYALYPHMSVYKNLAYGLRQRKTPKEEIDRRVHEIGEILGINELLDRKPAQLSGGQRQRVAMGRALVREPQAFLLDEPLSNLDAKLRGQVRAELKRIHQRLGHHLDLRHPRPGRGDDAGRPDLRDEPGRGAAAGHARRRSTTTRRTCSSPASWAARR